MVRRILIVVATTVFGFALGIWTQVTLAKRHTTETEPANISSTLSPLEMHREVKPGDLPIQYMEGEFN
jgi:hypothetical protein